MLYFSIGSARSGKSTLANKWRDGRLDIRDNKFVDPKTPAVFSKDNQASREFRVALGGDDIRTAIHGERYIHLVEGLTYAVKDIAIRALLNRGHHVLIDGTHTTESSIIRVLAIDIDATWVFVDTPRDVCMKRCASGPKEHAVEAFVIDRHWNNIQRLLDEGIERAVGRLRTKVGDGHRR